MQFKLSAVFFTLLYAAYVFATCRWPILPCAYGVSSIYVLGYASAVVVAYHSTGQLRAFCFAFATFGFFINWGAELCPEAFAVWVGENFADPAARELLDGYYYTVEGVLEGHLTFLVAIIAGFISQKVAKRQEHGPVALGVSDPQRIS